MLSLDISKVGAEGSVTASWYGKKPEPQLNELLHEISDVLAISTHYLPHAKAQSSAAATIFRKAP